MTGVFFQCSGGPRDLHSFPTRRSSDINDPSATVADPFPASLTATWTCVGAGGGTCTASGSGNINDTINQPVGGSVDLITTALNYSHAVISHANIAMIT